MLITGDGDEEEDAELLPPEARVTAADPSAPRVLSLLSFVLENLVTRNDAIAEACGGGGDTRRRLEAFSGARAPRISVRKYLERLYKYAECSPSCFVVGFVYIDRLAHAHPGTLLTSLNVHRLTVTSVMVASKMLDDVHYNNAFYARVGGLSNGELNRLELELLLLLDFGVMVTSRTFETYCHHLEKQAIMRNGSDVPRTAAPPAAVQDFAELEVGDDQPSS